MKPTLASLLVLASFAVAAAQDPVRSDDKYLVPLPQENDYAAAMREVARKFTGTQGVVIHVGDSMTIANPYTTWARQGRGRTPEDMAVLEWSHTNSRNRQLDGWWLARTAAGDNAYVAHTSTAGLTSKQIIEGGPPRRNLPPLENILDKFKPQMVVFMVGSYDADDKRPVEEYKKYMTQAVEMCLERNAIPILTTTCPRYNVIELSQGYNNALREIAKEKGLPVVELEKEVFRLRPDDWNGALQKRNGIHLTAGEAGGGCMNEPTPENLGKSGYHLRGYLTVKKIAEVKRTVIDPVVKMED
ncbi:MAG: SGNH/GDSL hydrolase family protein [Planctomycetaceae bacterium]